jgi:hypothetical protein
VRALVQRFVPVADEVGFLQRVDSEEGALFRKVAEQGHYAGRTVPTSTRQGLYAAAPSGVLLASINHNDPRRVERMLEQALEKWDAMPREERVLPGPPAPLPDRARLESRRPEDGLLLRVTSRDLARGPAALPPGAAEWHARAWNRDTLWFRADEARSWVPASREVGATAPVPAPLVRRIARFNLVDNVRGQTPPFEDAHVKEATLVARVVRTEGTRVHLRFDGNVRIEAEGVWHVGGLSQEPPTAQRRGFHGTLLGRGTWDEASGRFVDFEMVAAGMRHGATRYNGRANDLGPAPMGVAFTLAPIGDRVAPAAIWSYGW